MTQGKYGKRNDTRNNVLLISGAVLTGLLLGHSEPVYASASTMATVDTASVSDQTANSERENERVKSQATQTPVVTAGQTNTDSVQEGDNVKSGNNSSIDAPELSAFPSLANFYVDPVSNEILYDINARVSLHPYVTSSMGSQIGNQLYGFYVVLPQTVTGDLSSYQTSANDFVTALNESGDVSIDTLTVYKLNNLADGREVYYFRPNDGAKVKKAGATGAGAYVKLYLAIKTVPYSASAPTSFQINANNVDERAANGVLYAGLGHNTGKFTSSYQSMLATDVGITDAPDQYMTTISYKNIGRTATYVRMQLQDTYNVVNSATGETIKTITTPKDADHIEYSTYSRVGLVDTLKSLGLSPNDYIASSLKIDSGQLTDDVELTRTSWTLTTGKTRVFTGTGHTYTITVDPAEANTIQLKENEKTIVAGSTWDSNYIKNNFKWATTSNNTEVPFSDIEVTITNSAGDVVSEVDPNVPDTYTITYQLKSDSSIKATTAVTVTQRKTNIALKNTAPTLTVGDTWSSQDNISAVTNVDGTSVDLDKVTVTVTDSSNKPLAEVDTTKAGKYTVTYHFEDAQGHSYDKTITVTVTAKTPEDNNSGNGQPEDNYPGNNPSDDDDYDFPVDGSQTIEGFKVVKVPTAAGNKMIVYSNYQAAEIYRDPARHIDRFSNLDPKINEWQVFSTAIDAQGKVIAYRLGHNQWVAAKDIQVTYPLSGIFVAQAQTPLYNRQGVKTGIIEQTMAYKTFAVSYINGRQAIRLGNEKQWIYASTGAYYPD